MTAPTARDHIETAQAELTAALGLLPPDPPPAGNVWSRLDAAAAQVDPNNDPLMAAFQKYAVPANGGPYFTAAVAIALAAASDPLYPVTITSEKVPALSARIPLGTRPGCTADHSLTVLQPDLSAADFSGAVYDPNSRHILSAAGGAPVPAGAVNETGPGSANAAAIPLAAGPIDTANLEAFKASPSAGLHPLVFSCPNLGPAPNRYPARAGSAGYPGGTGIVLGTRIRLNPAAIIGQNPTLIDRYVFACLKAAGMYCRDINPAPYGTLSIIGTDRVNQGGNAQDWPTAGVPLPISTQAGIPYACHLTAAIPWAQLQILVPPTP